MRRLLTWARRLVVTAVLVAVVRQVLGRVTRSGVARDATLPPVVGDTWPPVPTNPDRGG